MVLDAPVKPHGEVRDVKPASPAKEAILGSEKAAFAMVLLIPKNTVPPQSLGACSIGFPSD